ncbi:MAG: YitT family protein [Muribaculaceae bacterium]|nr:YitT family protein [Muribaculaceae bacterium]
MHISPNKIWLSAKDYFIITFGIFLYAFGFSAFINPERVMMGGMAGVGQIVYYTTLKLFGHGLPIAVAMYAGNLILLAIAYKTVGRTFVVRTVFGATVISVFIGILAPIFPEPLIADQKFMNVIIGSIMCGMGVGMAFTHNGSTGGTDIVAAIVSKKTNVSVGRTMQYTDFCIISSSFLISGVLENVVLGFINLFIASFVTDQIINTNRQAVQFTIFSHKWEEIATIINIHAHRGCTIIDGVGWYTRKPTKMLLVMCRKIEAVTIFRIVKSVDPDAFITQTNVNGVYGRGFDQIKQNVKPLNMSSINTADEHAAVKADNVTTEK